MTVLVLCIDRDDDLGVKAGVQSPLVGRAANVQAATALSLADPEDSDANSVFGAVHLYDELVKQGVEAEVVTLCGHPRVGPVSDRRIAVQLDRLLEKQSFESCIFVTDGAEDEFLLPLVTSRVPVEAVRRIIVKQHADMESTYYVIKKALADEKLQRGLVLPFALACLVFGIFAVLGKLVTGLGAIFITVGLYGLMKILHVEERLKASWEYLYTGLTTGRLAFFTLLAAILLVSVGAAWVGRDLLFAEDPLHPTVLVLTFLGDMAWWVMGAIFIAAAGKVGDAFLRENVILWHYSMLPFSLVSIGLLVQTASRILADLAREKTFAPSVADGLIVGLSVVILTGGYYASNYVKARLQRPADEAHLTPQVRGAEEPRIHP